MGHHYRFHSRWHVPGSPAEIYSVLLDVAGYPSWWPQVLSSRELADGVGEIRVRSALPYELSLVLTRQVEDADRRILRAALEGDLIGWSEWEVVTDGSHDPRRSLVHFREEVELGRRGLRRLPALVRPILSANHAHMMRGGERGLREFVASSA